MRKTVLFCCVIIPVVLCSVIVNAQVNRSGYFQQKTDYSLTASLDVNKKILKGSGELTYQNNSTDTLKTLWWHLYQNVYKENTLARKNNIQISRAYEITPGITVDEVIVDGTRLEMRVDETLMETPLVKELLPGKSLKINVTWSYKVPETASLRTGSSGADFGIAQWYPQLAVYDAKYGWDKTPYLGIAEFYTEYGNWDVTFSLPGNYKVAATGVLKNADVVLSPEIAKRLTSLSQAAITKVITPAEVQDTLLFNKQTVKAWHFTAENVRDFALAASPDFVWDATKTSGNVNIYAFYKAADTTASFPLLISNATNWDKGVFMAKHAIEYFSKNFGDYVYPQATVVSGPVTGMEYPMMIFADQGDAISASLEMVIAHELGHEWYPMMVGSNETRHPFMDEGFNTYITGYVTQDWQQGKGLFNKDFYEKYKWMNLPRNTEHWLDKSWYINEARSGRGASLLSHPYDIETRDYGVYAYMKPGSVLLMLSDVIGKETLHKALREYMNRWRFRHPYPEDFFAVVEEVSGQNLTWFRHQWFEEKWKLDISVEGLENTKTTTGYKSTITFASNELAKMPFTFRVVLKDGSSKDYRFPLEKWSATHRADFVIENLSSEPVNVIADPEEILSDINRLNNSYCMPAPEFDYGFNLAGKLIYPMDRYRINIAPAFGFNLRDGLELGTSINGSYMATDYNTTLQIRHGIRSNIPDLEFSYSTPVRSLSPDVAIGASAFRLDGRHGGTLSFSGSYDKVTSLASGYKQSLGFTALLGYISVDNRSYLADQNQWTNGEHIYSKVSGFYRKQFNTGTVLLKSGLETGMPGGEFSYSVFTAEARANYNSLFAGVRSRIFYTTRSGNTPAQSGYTFAQSSGLEQFDRWLFRTPVYGSKTREHLYSAGGGNMLIGSDKPVASMLTTGLSLHKSMLVIFGDAGAIIDTASGRFSKPYFDAGVGLEIRPGNFYFGGFNAEIPTLSVMFPFYVSNPAQPDEKKFAYRWQIVYGVRF